MAPLSEAKQLETLLELQRDLALEANVEKVLLRITLAATFMLEADRATLGRARSPRAGSAARVSSRSTRSAFRSTARASRPTWPERAPCFV